jgi:hypothetical protein
MKVETEGRCRKRCGGRSEEKVLETRSKEEEAVTERCEGPRWRRSKLARRGGLGKILLHELGAPSRLTVEDGWADAAVAVPIDRRKDKVGCGGRSGGVGERRQFADGRVRIGDKEGCDEVGTWGQVVIGGKDVLKFRLVEGDAAEGVHALVK